MRPETRQEPHRPRRKGDVLDWWLWWHFPIRAWEREGRTWELLGLGAYYTFLLRITGEQDFRNALTALERGEATLTKADVEWNHQECRYHDAVNTIRVGFLSVPFVALLSVGSVWATWVGAFILLHLLSLSVDRMKQGVLHRYERRALELGLSLPTESAKTGPIRCVPTPFHKQPWRRWYDPKSWETETFFRIVGVVQWQVWVIWLTRKAWHRADDWTDDSRTGFFREGSRQELVNFEHSTRIGETIHLFGIATMIPPLLALWHHGLALAFVWMALVIGTDVEFWLLLRYHRSRIWKLYQRIAARATA